MTYSPIYTSVALVQAKTGLSNTDVDLTTDANLQVIIEDAEVELELLTGKKWTNSNSKTEYIDGPKKDVMGYSGTKARTIEVSDYPILTITEFKLLYDDGTTNTTFANMSTGVSTTDYWCEVMDDPVTNTVITSGKIVLKTQEFPVGHQNIKIAYTYGYATVPVMVRNLATCLAAMRLWARFLGGNYSRLNSYSVPEQSVDRGDIYVRGKQNIEALQAEAEKLLDRIGRRPRVLAFSSGSDR